MRELATNPDNFDSPPDALLLPSKRRRRRGGKNPGTGGGHGAAPWEWTPQREAVAVDIALGEISLDAIAQKNLIDSSTLYRWRDTPEMQTRIGELHASFRKVLENEGIASVAARVERRNAYWDKLKTVVDERSQSPDMQEVPGGRTGLLVKQYKGKNAEFKVDDGLLAEMDRLERSTAVDLGQRVEQSRVEVSGPGGGPIRLDAQVTIGYQNGALRDIAEEFFKLLEDGMIPDDVDLAILAVRTAATAKNIEVGGHLAKVSSEVNH